MIAFGDEIIGEANNFKFFCGAKVSGHSKWSQIKRQKGAADLRRSNLFSKLSNTIAAAVRTGQGLDIAVERAKSANMPKDKIEMAIARAKGAQGRTVEELILEGFGPENVAIIVKAYTDNKNRTLSDIRNIFTKGNGRLANSGAVAHFFDLLGIIRLEKKDISTEKSDELELLAIDQGALDIRDMEDVVEIQTKPVDLFKVKKAVEEAGGKILEAKLEYIPKANVNLPDEVAKEKVINLLEALEDQAEVDEVFTNGEL